MRMSKKGKQIMRRGINEVQKKFEADRGAVIGAMNEHRMGHIRRWLNPKT